MVDEETLSQCFIRYHTKHVWGSEHVFQLIFNTGTR